MGNFDKVTYRKKRAIDKLGSMNRQMVSDFKGIIGGLQWVGLDVSKVAEAGDKAQKILLAMANLILISKVKTHGSKQKTD